MPNSDYYICLSTLLLLLLLLLLYLFHLDKVKEEEKLKEKIDEAFQKSNYISIRNAFLKKVFDTNKVHQEIKASSVLVGNFGNHKEFDYLVKYFGMKIENDTVKYFERIEEATDSLFFLLEEENIDEDFALRYLPDFTMTYVSAQGRSSSSSTVTFDLEKLIEIRKKIQRIQTRRLSVQFERRKLTPSLREKILKRDHYTCQNCGNSRKKEPNLLLEVDHIIPVSRGGKTEENNLQTLCWKCNRSKSDSLS